MDRKDFEQWLFSSYPQFLVDTVWHDNEQRYTVMSSAQILWEAWQVAADEIERLHAENESLRKVFDAAENLVKVKGRFHSEQAYGRLVTAVAGMKVEE